MTDTTRDDETRDRAERMMTNPIQPGTMPGTQYEDPSQALTPSAGSGAGATGPGGAGRSDMRDVGDSGSGADSGYGTPDGVPIREGRPQDRDPSEAAGGVPRPTGFDAGIDAQVSNTLIDPDESSG